MVTTTANLRPVRPAALQGVRTPEEAMGIDLDHAYRRFGPMVRRRCQQLLRDPEAARDATQDVFVRLTRRRDELDDRALSSLLYRMATGICLNRIRDFGRHPTIPDDDLIARIARTSDPTGPLTARNVLSRLFAREPASTRVIATLHLLDGYTLQEVADEVGLSVSGVRYRLRGLRAQLAELQEEEL
jgi:RNA polymerase sigma-70 factor (ECF subfamily)